MKYFIIRIRDSKDKLQYVCSGEYSTYSLTSSIKNALWFDTEEQVKLALQHKDFTERNVYSEDSSSPPSIIWSGLGICNARKKADGFIEILKVEVKETECIYVQDELKDRK